MHVHTHHSPDGVSSIKAVLKKAKERQLDIVAITDHNTLKGALEAKKMAPEFGIEIIVGEEIRAKEGDIIALFIEERIKPGRPATDTIKEIRAQGGLSICPHPDNWVPGGIAFRHIFNIYEHLHGIELLNGGWFGWLKQEQTKKLNETTFNLAAVGGSDSHLARQVGCAWTNFEGKTPSDLYASIQAKTTFPGGAYWTYPDCALLLLNSPRIICKYPKLPLLLVNGALKRIFVGNDK